MLIILMSVLFFATSVFLSECAIFGSLLNLFFLLVISLSSQMLCHSYITCLYYMSSVKTVKVINHQERPQSERNSRFNERDGEKS